MDKKTDLRIRAKALRKELDISSASSNIIRLVRKEHYYINAKNVLLFYPMKYEIDLLDLLNNDKNFYLPKVNGDNLYVCPFKKGDELKQSGFKGEEPCSSPVSPEILDLIFVPALMVDAENYRLGYGGGFYDRFLGKYPKAVTVVPIAKELCVEKLPREDYDMKTDFIIKG